MSGAVKMTLPMPRLGETMDEGTISEWLVAPGQAFRRGDPLLEVESDKTAVEYPALGDGTLIETLVGPGDVVPVGAPIAVIETAAGWDGPDGGPDASPGPEPEPEPEVATPERAPPSAAERPDTGTGLRATPLARRIARQSGIDLHSVTGTGRRGRIEAEDVRSRSASAAGPGLAYFVHGFAGLGSNWAALRARLQVMGLKGTAPDLPGHGASRAEAPGVAALVEWLAGELAGEAGAVHLVGHSLGAHVAALAALRAPSRVARLTLIAPAGCGLEIDGRFAAGMAAAPGPGELAHLMRLLGPKAAALDAAALASMAEGLKGGRLSALAGEMARGDVQRLDTIGALKALAGRMPVTAIFGLEDRIIPRDQLFNLPPDVACHVVGAGHMPHWDAVEDVARIITGR